MAWFKGFSKKATAKGFQGQKSSQVLELETFILEPILTPSGLVDGDDHSHDLLLLDVDIPTLPEVHLAENNQTDAADTSHVTSVETHSASEVNSDSHSLADSIVESGHSDILATHQVDGSISDSDLEHISFIEPADTTNTHSETVGESTIIHPLTVNESHNVDPPSSDIIHSTDRTDVQVSEATSDDVSHPLNEGISATENHPITDASGHSDANTGDLAGTEVKTGTEVAIALPTSDHSIIDTQLHSTDTPTDTTLHPIEQHTESSATTNTHSTTDDVTSHLPQTTATDNTHSTTDDVTSHLPKVTDTLPITSSERTNFSSGVFTVGETGEVGIDFLFDGGGYKGELAIFSLKNMENLTPGSSEFIKEAATRALSNSDFGHVVISDITEGAKFSGNLPGEGNQNSGVYEGVKTFKMTAGDEFGVMLVPNAKVQQLFDNPNAGGSLRPLFSLVTANPNEHLHIGQIADVTGEGNTFVMEDLRVDGSYSDKDYNDIIFQVRGATGKAVHLDEVIAPGKDWRTSDMGQALIAYAEPYVTPDVTEDVDLGDIGVIGHPDDNAISSSPDISHPDNNAIAPDPDISHSDNNHAIAPDPDISHPDNNAIAPDTSHPTTDTVSKVPTVEKTTVVESAIAPDTSHPTTVTVTKVPAVEKTTVVESAIAPDTSHPTTDTVTKVPAVEKTTVVENAIASDTSHPTTDTVTKVPAVEKTTVVESAIAPDTSHPTTDTVTKVPAVEKTTVVESAIAPDTSHPTTDTVTKVPAVEKTTVVENAIAPDTSHPSTVTETVIKVPTVEKTTVVETAIAPDTSHPSTVTETVIKVPTVEKTTVVETAIAPDTSHPTTVTEAVTKVPTVEKTTVVESAIAPDTSHPTTVTETVIKVPTVEKTTVVENAIAPDRSSATTVTNVTPTVPSTSTVEHSTVVTTSTTQTPSAVEHNSTTPASGVASTTGVEHSAQTTTPTTTSTTVTTTQAAPPIQAPPVKVAVPKPPVSFDFPKANQPLVGVIDTGFSANNPDINYSQIKLGHDYVGNDANPLVQPSEGNDPGTQALGIIAAKQNNGIGIDGINDKAPVWVGRAEVSSDQWAQSLMEFVDAAKASKQPNAVVNLSFNLTNLDGTSRFDLTGAERAALAYAQHNNVLIVASAGDNPGEMSAIGQASLEFDNIVTVGSAERVNNSVALSKAYDRAEYSGSGYALDIVAPGGTDEKPITVTSGDGVTKEFGTSVATAKVSGAASQVWAANPDLSYRQVIDILKRTATDLKTPNWDIETGAGLLNIAAAVHLAKVTPAIDVDVPVRYDFKKSDQPLIGIVDTGFISKNPDIDYRRIILGRDRVDNDSNPLLENGQGSEHGSHILGIIGATQGNGIGIDGMNDDAPIWLGRAIGSGKWAESLREFVDAAKASGQPNAVVNLSFDLTQINPDGSVTTRYELTPQEREALEYARQNGVMVVAAAGNDGGTMSALGQASQEFDNVITVGSIDYNGNRADYSNFGFGLDFVARGGTPDQPVMSTVGDGADIGLLSGEEEPPEDEMSTIAKNTFEEVFGPFSDPEKSVNDEQELENLTPEERQVYDEATKEIDQLLKDYLDAASQKIALEYVDGYYAASVDALSQFVDAFDEDLADNLIKAEEILGNAGFSTNASTTATNLDFSIPLDLGVGEMAGTSVAAAKVTGAVSQVWAANPRLSYPQVKEILQKTAVDLNSRGWDAATGSGLVNVEAAIELAKRTQPQSYQPKPIQSPLTWSGEGKVTPGERAVSVSVPSFTGRVMNAGYVTSVGFLRIRSGPGQNYAEVGRKYPGEAINFDAYENNGLWVDDPYMPGGGSNRWYKIAGTNNWMSALYIDNTPERAEQERQRLEAIRRVEEEARRAEEEVRRAEEEVRRAEEELRRILEEQRRAEEEARRRAEEEARRRIEEELRRILEEQRRRQEQLQAAINQVSQKVGDLGTQLGSYISNGVAVYHFAKGSLLIQPDGNSAFYENVIKPFNENIWSPLNSINFGRKEFSRIPAPNVLIDSFVKSNITDPKGFWKTLDTIYPATKFFPADSVLSGAAYTREFFVNGNGTKLIKGLNSIGDILNKPVIKKLASNSPVVGDVIDLGFMAADLTLGDDKDKRRATLKLSAMGLAGVIGLLGGPPVSVGAALAASALMDIAYLGFDKTGNGEVLDGAIENSFNAIGSGFNAVSSFTSNAIEAAKAKAQGALEKANAAAVTAKAAYQVATATVQQANAVYQTFKQEIQKQTTQIVQQSQQKIKEEAQKILTKVVQNPVVQQTSKVVNHIANYAQKAVQAVGGVINGAKQFANNIINAGKKMVNNVIETGKKAYETVKNFVANTYETGKKVVTETYNKAVQAVNTVKDTVSNGFNAVKSVFRFGW